MYKRIIVIIISSYSEDIEEYGDKNKERQDDQAPAVDGTIR